MQTLNGSCARSLTLKMDRNAFDRADTRLRQSRRAPDLPLSAGFYSSTAPADQVGHLWPDLRYSAVLARGLLNYRRTGSALLFGECIAFFVRVSVQEVGLRDDGDVGILRL